MNLPNAYDMLRWIHLLCIAMAAGGMVVCLLVSGFEDTREDIRGLAAVLWSKVVAWGLRLGLLTGLGLAGWAHKVGGSPFSDHWLLVKLVLVVILIGLSESAPKALARSKRGGALLAMLVLLLATFIAGTYLFSYRGLFTSRHSSSAPAVMAPAK